MRGYLVAKKYEDQIKHLRMYKHFEYFDRMKKDFYDKNANIIIRCLRKVIVKNRENNRKQEQLRKKNTFNQANGNFNRPGQAVGNNNAASVNSSTQKKKVENVSDTASNKKSMRSTAGKAAAKPAPKSVRMSTVSKSNVLRKET